MEQFTVKCKNGEMVRDGPWPELEDVRPLEIPQMLQHLHYNFVYFFSAIPIAQKCMKFPKY